LFKNPFLYTILVIVVEKSLFISNPSRFQGDIPKKLNKEATQMNSRTPQKHGLSTKVLGITLLISLANIDLTTNLSLSTTNAELANTLTNKFIPLWQIAGLDTTDLSNASNNVSAFIHFGFNSAFIKKESYSRLREYAKTLQSDLAEAVVEIGGHTDNLGSDEYNSKLSKRRAQAVKDFLTEKHKIAAYRLIINGYGESQPIESNDTQQGRAKNRRVEFVRIGTL
jgi:outer membrane protein OmpA-like peptidoglycan-associated protein